MIIASKGAAGVTGAGMATLAGGLSSHRPELVDGVGLIVGIDRFMSEARALTNFAGNAIATVLIGHWTDGLDRERLDKVLAGDLPFDEAHDGRLRDDDLGAATGERAASSATARGRPRRLRPVTGVARSTIARRSPPSRVPKTPSYDVPSRDAQKTSATSGGAKRTSSEPCRHSAIRTASRRALTSIERRVAHQRAEQRERVLDRPVQAGVAAPGPADLGDPGVEHLGLAAEGAQHVERVDVAGALPDRVQRRLAVEQRHARTPRRTRCRRGTRAPRRPRPGCACRPRTSTSGSAIRRSAASCGSCEVVDGGGEPDRERGGGLGLDGEVGQHVLHQRLVDRAASRRPSGARRARSPR